MKLMQKWQRKQNSFKLISVVCQIMQFTAQEETKKGLQIVSCLKNNDIYQRWQLRKKFYCNVSDALYTSTALLR